MFDNEESYSNSYKGFSFRESYTKSGSIDYSSPPSNSPFSVLTSSKEVHSFSTANSSYDDWNAYSVTGTGSFVSVHKDVNSAVLPDFQPQARAGIAFPDSTSGGYVPPTGSTDSEAVSPVGAPVFPLLLMACIYVIIQRVLSRKKTNIANSVKS